MMGEKNRDYDTMVERGQITELFKIIREDYEVLAHFKEFSHAGAVLDRIMEKYPQFGKQLLLELVRGRDGERVVKMLESLTLTLSFSWNGYRCYIKGNILFYAVWIGAHDLIRELLERGMDPDGTSRDIYVTKDEAFVAPFSRWGKMKCRENQNTFSSFYVWPEDPWGPLDQMKGPYLITPLFLAELVGDTTMIDVLKNAGACPMPPREKMWEEAKAPEDTGSVFGNL